jgi:hypothetical protein
MARTGLKVAQLANGTDGELITWDASGAPATVAVGTAGHVLTSNGVGAAPTFQAVASGSSSSGISGAVQFSGGSGAFSSDASNFFYNDSTNQLKLAGGTGYGLLLEGIVNGASIAPASSITGAFNALNVNADATGSLNVLIQNNNTSNAGSHSKLRLATSAGGGDPFLQIMTAEVGYIIGVDNSGSDKMFFGIGSDPSTMTTTHITLSGSATGILQTTPTAKLHIAGGATGANSAPLKIDSGTAMTTPEDGAIEYHGSHLYFTIGSTRYQLDQQSASISDGDKGDITVSSSGTVWTIDNLAVTNAKINDVSVAKLTSGTTTGGLTLTLPTSSSINFNYFGGNTALNILDSTNAVSMFSKDGTQFVSADNTSVLIGSGGSQMQYIDSELRIYDSDATQYVGIRTPATASLTTSYTLTLPTDDGVSGQVLATNGTGGLSWATNASGDVSGPASSVDSEIALFNSTTGKLIKSATGTGVAIVTSGVLSTKTNPTGAFVGDTDTQTLSAKRMTPRVTSTTSSSTPTPNIANEDIYILTALAANATFGSPTGTPVQGDRLIVRIKDNGTSRTLAWNAIYRAIGVTLPTATTINKTLYVGFVYNSTDTKWDCIAVSQEA